MLVNLQNYAIQRINILLSTIENFFKYFIPFLMSDYLFSVVDIKKQLTKKNLKNNET